MRTSASRRRAARSSPPTAQRVLLLVAGGVAGYLVGTWAGQWLYGRLPAEPAGPAIPADRPAPARPVLVTTAEPYPSPPDPRRVR